MTKEQPNTEVTNTEPQQNFFSIDKTLPEKEEEKTSEKEETAAEKSEYNELEQEALKLGWNPEYKGNGKYRSAEDWLEWREVTQKLRNQSKEIKTMRNVVDQLNKFLMNRHEQEQQLALEDLKVRRDQAVETGDMESFKKYDELYLKAVANMKPIKSVADENIGVNAVKQRIEKALDDPQIRDWLNKNPWARPTPDDDFDNRMMRDYASTKEQEFFVQNPYGSQYEALLYAERAVREKFKDKFNPTFKYNAVESSKNAAKKTTKSKITINDLPSEERAVIRKMLATLNGKISEQEYIDELVKTGAIRHD